MTLNELRYIVAVARERHFGRASEACHISQPTLSVAVRKLEEELGVTLFERAPGEVGVTPVGRRIVEQAQRVLEEAAAVKRLASQGQDELTGMLRLGVIYTIGPYLLPHLIPRLRRRAPNMPLQIEENYTAVLSERLKDGELDVLILSLPFEEPGIMTRPVYEEPFVVLVPTGHPLEQVTTIDTPTLARQDLLLLGPGHCFRDQVLRFLSRMQPAERRFGQHAEDPGGQFAGNHSADGGDRHGHHRSALHLGQRLRAGRRPAQRPAVRGAGADPGRGAGLAQKLPAPPGHRAAVRGYSGLSAGRGGPAAGVSVGRQIVTGRISVTCATSPRISQRTSQSYSFMP